MSEIQVYRWSEAPEELRHVVREEALETARRLYYDDPERSVAIVAGELAGDVTIEPALWLVVVPPPLKCPPFTGRELLRALMSDGRLVVAVEEVFG